MAARRRAGVQKLALAVACLPLLVLFVAVMGIFVGAIARPLAFDLLAMGVARWLAYAAVAFAGLAFVLSLTDARRRLPWALAALALAGITTAGFIRHDSELRADPPVDVSTNPSDPPGAFASAGTTTATCPGLEPIPVQMQAPQASQALLDAGFVVQRAGLFEVQGVRQAFWFAGTHQAAVRIRPGRTDIRVLGRYPGSGPASCRLALRLREALQAVR